MLVNDETFGSLTPKKVRSILRGIKRKGSQKSKQTTAAAS